MRYGICPLAVVPIRLTASDNAEMVTQALYGEMFKIVEHRSKWSKVRFSHDKYEGWIDNKQLYEISSEAYHSITKLKTRIHTVELFNILTHADGTLSTITIGSYIDDYILEILGDAFSGIIPKTGNNDKADLVKNALIFLNAPYLWGGKTPLGIDCSGFTQLIYRLNGINLNRDASEQATQGNALSFIEESESGDLAFFDNAEGVITHVGIMMEDNHIIHAHGKVRIDRIDQTGIFNVDSQTHTHKLRVIKSVI